MLYCRSPPSYTRLPPFPTFLHASSSCFSPAPPTTTTAAVTAATTLAFVATATTLDPSPQPPPPPGLSPWHSMLPPSFHYRLYPSKAGDAV
mmetsp:Transcript_2557/g.5328  ORF Transcript_2557/g.5328 Transcript_2557/m.5328 type:complete len:91 (-) Transcript_2557:324-596(-)